VEGAPLRDVLGKFAEHNGLGIAIVDSVVYLGLPDRATQFAALIRDKKQQVARLPRSERQKWQNSTPLAWDALTEPRQLIAEIERQAGIRVSGQALVPHDLWAAGSWPPLPAASKLALVLVGFDLAPAVEPDGSCSIVPME
jgi:hypothetical protein